MTLKEYKVLTLVIALFATFLADAQCFTLVKPVNNSVVNNSAIELMWNTPQGATSYNVELAQNVQFDNNYQSFSSSVSSFTLPSNLSSGRWFWRVTTSIGPTVCSSDVCYFDVFSPSDIPTLKLWLSSDSLVSLDIDGKVQSWTDLSQNSFQFSADIPSRRPTVSSQFSLMNNQKAIDFNGAQRLISNSTFSFNNASVFLIGIQQAGEEGYGRFVDNGYNTGFWIGRRASANEVGGGFIESNPFGNFVSQADDLPFLLSYVRNAATTSYARNSADFPSPTRTTSGATTTVNKIYLGSDISNFAWGKKKIFNLIIYNSDLTSDQKRMVEKYLMDKYTPPVSLGYDRYPNYAPNSLCLNEVLASNINYSSYLWNTGETSSLITVTHPGKYWLTATDIFGRVTSDTIEVLPPISLNQPTNNFVCVNTSELWSTGYPDTYFDFSWQNGSNSSDFLITQPGNYWVEITDMNGCSFSSDTVEIILDEYEYLPYLGADTSLCTGNPIALQVGAAETVSYAWQGNAASTVPSFAVGGTGNYWVESVNINGCAARDTIFITNVGTAPIAQFSVSDHCKGLSSGIVDQSTGVGPDNVVLWHWNLGNGTELSQQTVNYTYPLAGNYPIELYVQSAGGCGAYHYDTVQVFETPQADFNFIGHCQGQEVLFSEGVIIGGAPISSYSWNFDMPWMGAYNTSTINIPNRIFDEVGTYDVVLQVTDGNGCQDAVTLPVVIDPTPVANYVFESTCQGSPIQFLNTSVTQASSTYLWDFGDNTSSILVNPSKTFPDFGIVPVQLSVTNLSGCTDTVLQNVQVFAFPLTSLQIGPACMDSYTTLENTSTVPLGAIDSTIWILNQTDTLFGADAAWMVNAIGQQQVDMFTWSDQGCMSQTSQFFDVNEQFNASFTIGPGIVATGQPFVFENTTNTASVSLWNFDDGGFSTDFSPVHTFDAAYADSILTVLLIALSPSGCVDSTTQEILIQRARIDLEITNLFLQKENAWYIMGVKLKNKGTVNIESAQLVVETTKGLLFNETWNGTLKPTEDSIYVFSGMPTTIFTDQDLVESYICVSGLGFDLYGNVESYLENNNVCRNIEGEGIVLLPVYPNPVHEDFTARIYVTKEAEVTFELTDDRGRVIENFINAQIIAEGYYDYTVNTDQLSPGVYFLKVRSNDTTQSSKLIFIRK